MKNSLYFFYGDEDFLIEEQVNRLLLQNKEKAKEIYKGEIFLPEVLNSALAMSLFFASKIFILKEPAFLYPRSKDELLLEKVKDKDKEQFVQICEAVKNNGFKMIIWAAQKKVDMRRQIPVYLKKNATCQEFKAFTNWEQGKVIAWTKEKIIQKGKKITPDALIAMEEITGNNLRKIVSEVEKIDIYTGKKISIDIDDIKQISGGKSANIFDFSEAIKEKDKSKMFLYGKKLLDNGEDPNPLLGLMISNFRLYYQILLLLQQGVPEYAIAQKLEKNPYYIQKLIPFIAKKYKLAELKTLFEKLAKKDFELKTGKMKPGQVFLLALAEVCVV